jgi:hypothetical protein
MMVLLIRVSIPLRGTGSAAHVQLNPPLSLLAKRGHARVNLRPRDENHLSNVKKQALFLNLDSSTLLNSPHDLHPCSELIRTFNCCSLHYLTNRELTVCAQLKRPAMGGV